MSFPTKETSLATTNVVSMKCRIIVDNSFRIFILNVLKGMQTCSERVNRERKSDFKSNGESTLKYTAQGPDIKEVENTEIQEGKSSFKLK